MPLSVWHALLVELVPHPSGEAEEPNAALTVSQGVLLADVSEGHDALKYRLTNTARNPKSLALLLRDSPV
eukprot:3979057-Amphidinium_carterae.2